MITILLGDDKISKEAHLTAVVADGNVELRRFRAGDQLPALSSLGEPTLFGPSPAYVFDRCWANLDLELLFDTLAESSTLIFILEDSVDQRKTINKSLLKDKRVTVKEFPAPSKTDALSWIYNHAKSLGIKLDTKATNALIDALVPDDNAKLDVSLAHNELEKLKAYAGQEKITPEMVDLLTARQEAIDVFKLLDAIGTKNKPEAYLLLNKFFIITDGDEKTKAIQASALLADQLRNILLVQDASTRNLSDAVILEKTGWKSGRLFIMRRLARNFSAANIKQAMSRLESLDMELKSSTLPPHVILDMIISQM